MTAWKPVYGDIVSVRAPGMFLNQEGYVSHVHGPHVTVRFRWIYDPLAKEEKQKGRSMSATFYKDELWFVRRPGGALS